MLSKVRKKTARLYKFSKVGSSVEGGCGVFGAVIDVENREQPRHLQHVPHARIQIREFDLSAGVFCRRVKARKRAEAAAVDIRDSAKVKHDAVGSSEHVLDDFAQVS